MDFGTSITGSRVRCVRFALSARQKSVSPPKVSNPDE